MAYFERNILTFLDKWKNNKNRKPLILRGARQTGKTVAVELFAKKFSQVVTLNLERTSDKNIFEKSETIEQTVQAIELAKNASLSRPDTLLFIDEIQNSDRAIKYLRFFYEDYPHIFTICAGSLLEAVMMKEGFSFPVGRVEFLYLYPVTFDEFLTASGREKILDALGDVTIKSGPSKALHDMAAQLFHQYAMVGGMPAVVSNFIEKNSIQSTADIKEDLITAIKDDVAKYSRTAEAKYLRHVIEYAPYYTGERIKYEKFGNSEYHSREIKRAFELLEYAMIVQRVYGSSSTQPPIQPNFGVAPKIVYLDSGLVIHRLGLGAKELFPADLNNIFKGKLAEQIVGQSLIAKDAHRKFTPCFWYRNTPSSTAETDYSYQLGETILPIEIKSGKSGSLKSIHQFMMASNTDKALRVYSGELSKEKVQSGGKTLDLISIPFYLLWRFEDLI